MVRIMTDNAANLPKHLLEQYGIGELCLTYTVDGEPADTAAEFDGRSFYDAMRRGAVVQTSMVTPDAARQGMEPHLVNGDDVLYVGLSGGVSGTCWGVGLVARELAEQYPERKIRVLDSRGASLGEGLIVLEAARLAAEGRVLEEIVVRCEELCGKMRQHFMVDDLKFLRKGGRISGSAALAGTLLQIKPILQGDPEGKIVVLVNGSPSAMVLPALFCENFECLDDYASTAVFSSFLRILKYVSFYLTVFLPGVFVCLAVYLPELIPPQLLYKIEAAEKATPLPLFAEMLLVILILEVIREAGLRMPQSLGHSVSLVSALIIGDAAIATGLMSTPVIFVASITAIAVFVTPSLYEPATLLRLGVVLAAGLAGPVGLAGAFFAVLLSLSGTACLQVPYLAAHPFPQRPMEEDGIIRRNYRRLSAHDFNIWQKREGK